MKINKLNKSVLKDFESYYFLAIVGSRYIFKYIPSDKFQSCYV